jgi:phosphoribosylanthranilate isomerase
MSIRIKICGITSAADALTAVQAGADALGFMLYQTSPRRVKREQAATIIRVLPPFVTKVGVFVNPTEAEVRAAIAEVGIDTLQFHGEESPEFCRQFGLKVIKAFRVRDAGSLQQAQLYASEAWLLDSYVAGQPGGTGVTVNWELAADAARRHSWVILAGGLTPKNVADAVQKVRPFGVDVASGVESAPGEKDPDKVRAFIAAARSAERAEI